MDDFEHYRCRHIYLQQSDEASKQAEENARDNMGSDVASFEATASEDHKIPHQSPDKYWEDYH